MLKDVKKISPGSFFPFQLITCKREQKRECSSHSLTALDDVATGFWQRRWWCWRSEVTVPRRWGRYSCSCPAGGGTKHPWSISTFCWDHTIAGIIAGREKKPSQSGGNLKYWCCNHSSDTAGGLGGGCWWASWDLLPHGAASRWRSMAQGTAAGQEGQSWLSMS